MEAVTEEVILNMNASTIQLSITVLEDVKGVLLDASAYPDYSKAPSKFQSSYWLEYQAPNGIVSTSEKRVLFEQGVTEEDKSRVNFN